MLFDTRVFSAGSGATGSVIFFTSFLNHLLIFITVYVISERKVYIRQIWDNISVGEIMLITLFRTLILYILIIFTMRVLGKRQIGELQPAELVITILLSEIMYSPDLKCSYPS